MKSGDKNKDKDKGCNERKPALRLSQHGRLSPSADADPNAVQVGRRHRILWRVLLRNDARQTAVCQLERRVRPLLHHEGDDRRVLLTQLGTVAAA